MTYGDTEHPHAECRETIADLQEQVEQLKAESVRHCACELADDFAVSGRFAKQCLRHADLEQQVADLTRDREGLRTLLVADLDPMPCGHVAKWLAYRDPVDPTRERYCVLCEVERLRARLQAAEYERDTVYAALEASGWNTLDGRPEEYVRRLAAKAGGCDGEL